MYWSNNQVCTQGNDNYVRAAVCTAARVRGHGLYDVLQIVETLKCVRHSVP